MKSDCAIHSNIAVGTAYAERTDLAACISKRNELSGNAAMAVAGLNIKIFKDSHPVIAEGGIGRADRAAGNQGIVANTAVKWNLALFESLFQTFKLVFPGRSSPISAL